MTAEGAITVFTGRVFRRIAGAMNEDGVMSTCSRRRQHNVDNEQSNSAQELSDSGMNAVPEY
jgi:hypothetical protein